MEMTQRFKFKRRGPSVWAGEVTLCLWLTWHRRALGKVKGKYILPGHQEALSGSARSWYLEWPAAQGVRGEGRGVQPTLGDPAPGNSDLLCGSFLVSRTAESAIKQRGSLPNWKHTPTDGVPEKGSGRAAGNTGSAEESLEPELRPSNLRRAREDAGSLGASAIRRVTVR